MSLIIKKDNVQFFVREKTNNKNELGLNVIKEGTA